MTEPGDAVEREANAIARASLAAGDVAPPADGTTMQATIDHIVERQTAPGRALDPTNLRISTRRENTVMLRQVTAQDPFQ